MSPPIVILIHIRRISRFLDSILSSKRVHLGRLSSERNYGSECESLKNCRYYFCMQAIRTPIPDRTYRRLSIDMLLSFSPFHQIGPATKNLFSPIPSEHRSWTYHFFAIFEFFSTLNKSSRSRVLHLLNYSIYTWDVHTLTKTRAHLRRGFPSVYVGGIRS